MLLLCKVYEKWKEHYMFKGVMSGLKPATLGLIGTAALYFKKVGPFGIIGLGALVGLLIY